MLLLLYDVMLHYSVLTLHYDIIMLCLYFSVNFMILCCIMMYALLLHYIMMSLFNANVIMLHYDVFVLCYYLITLC